MIYEELPKWIQDFLSYHHIHLLTYDDFKGEKYDEDGCLTDEYDKYIDEHENIYYEEKYVIQLINCLLNNRKIALF